MTAPITEPPSSHRKLMDVNFILLEEDNRTRERKLPNDLKNEPGHHPELDDPSLKRILLWNDMYGKLHYTFGLGREPFIRAGCPINKCITTSNRTRYPLLDIDALVWHFRSSDKELPKLRSSHTRYVFWMQESPMNLYGDLQLYNNIFNWTFTYRLDSDFPSPAGFVMRRSKIDYTVLTFKAAQQKNKFIAWFVSNCKSASGRENLVRSLQQYIPVDIYGECGPYKCKRSEQTHCYEMLEKDYKFYLSFENSLCKDYITEKFFHLLQ
ncbi:Galactoside 3(4)-L-fucosyltransferase [Halocaridina rubra]|uniref:Fucosyltransferase n=1 Tax=Halocaridina rubra TaxID=373956 RepID=A0AAN8XIG0_HALRR